jgi:hypothetical protein
LLMMIREVEDKRGKVRMQSLKKYQVKRYKWKTLVDCSISTAIQPQSKCDSHTIKLQFNRHNSLQQMFIFQGKTNVHVWLQMLPEKSQTQGDVLPWWKRGHCRTRGKKEKWCG